jgi:aspartate/methionine/tyrosine aminotransferase
MSGLRIGYVVAEKELVKRMREENAAVVIHPGTIEQIGAAAALKCDGYVNSLRDYLQRVRDRLVAKLREAPGVEIRSPEGAFFAFPNLSALFESVLVYAGSGFGRGGAGHVRMTFCSPISIIEEAAERVVRALSRRAASRRSLHDLP